MTFLINRWIILLIFRLTECDAYKQYLEIINEKKNEKVITFIYRNRAVGSTTSCRILHIFCHSETFKYPTLSAAEILFAI